MSKDKKAGTRTEQEAKAIAQMLRVSPQKLNLVAQMIRGKKAASGLKSAKDGRVVVREQVRKLVRDYQKAGYGISGTTADGVVIVKPSGKPDSFNLHQLDKAFSQAHTKN